MGKSDVYRNELEPSHAMIDVGAAAFPSTNKTPGRVEAEGQPCLWVCFSSIWMQPWVVQASPFIRPRVSCAAAGKGRLQMICVCLSYVWPAVILLVAFLLLPAFHLSLLPSYSVLVHLFDHFLICPFTSRPPPLDHHSYLHIMHRVPAPDTRELLPPTIACLPTAFFSPRPPPALLPLLSPILRQRLHLHTSNASSANQSRSPANWLPLLTWSNENAERLADVVSRMQLEPHPVSGELELFTDEDGDDGRVFYRRLDAETLQARCNVPLHNIAVHWVWCVNDTGVVGLEDGAGAGAEPTDGWKVAEVLPMESEDGRATFDTTQWYNSVQDAEQAAEIVGLSGDDLPSFSQPGLVPPRAPSAPAEDDDYWASYDRTPSRTPARTPAKHSPAPGSLSTAQQYRDRQMSTYSMTSEAEADYYARYGDEVQPALDNHDPDEAQAAKEAGIHVPQAIVRQVEHERNTNEGNAEHNVDTSARNTANDDQTRSRAEIKIHSPQPSRPHSAHSSHSSDDVANLEAAAMSKSWMSGASESSTTAEAGVKRHIGMEIKSLFRLAQNVGIERTEFDRMVKTELELLGLIEL